MLLKPQIVSTLLKVAQCRDARVYSAAMSYMDLPEQHSPYVSWPAEIDQLVSGCCQRNIALQLPGPKLVSWDSAELYHMEIPTLSLHCPYKHCITQHRHTREANSMGRSMFYGSLRRDEDNPFLSSDTFMSQGRLRANSGLKADVGFTEGLIFLQPLCRKSQYKESRKNKIFIFFLYLRLSLSASLLLKSGPETS